MIGISNARDFDGILVGGQPTDAQLDEAAQSGFTTIVNLRALTEAGVTDEKAKVEARGMRYVAIPMSGGADLTDDNARKLAEALEGQTEGGKVMVHCASGNRVGALFAIKAHVVDGVPAEEAVGIGKRAGLTGLEGAVRAKLGV